MGANQSMKEHHNFLLIGRTGNGKSSSGNAIVGKEYFFVPFHRTLAVTKSVRGCQIKRWGKKLHIVDTPGLTDPELDAIENAEFARNNMTKSFKVCPDGFRAFLIVLNYTNKFNNEEKRVIETLTEILGEEMFASTILIFTHGDNFDIEQKVVKPEESQVRFANWCRQMNGNELQKLLQKCNYRAVLFHNHEENQKKRDVEIVTLFKMSEHIKQHYTKNQFDKNETRRSMLVLNLYHKELTEKIIKDLDEMKDELQLIKSQKEVLFEKAKTILAAVKNDEIHFPEKTLVEKNMQNLLDNFESKENNQDKFNFLSNILDEVNGPILKQLATLSADISKILNPERHKCQLKRKVCELLQYIKEQDRGTNELQLEEQRVKLFQAEVEDLDTEGIVTITEIK